MSNVLRKIFLGEAGEGDQEIHEAFIKYGKGEFKDKYLIEAKKQKDKWSIKTSAEFGNYLVKRCLSGVDKPVHFKGVIVCTFDIKDKINFKIERVKQFMGIKQIVIDTELDSNEILKLIDEFPRAFFALTFKTDKNELKIKAKAPKNAKPSSKGEKKAKADFCSLKTTDPQMVTDLFFDYPEFKFISINHTINIKDIKIPENIEDPVEMREKAIRKGKILRNVIADGNEVSEEKEFIA